MTETASLREELAAKRAEYNALMARDNPDPEQAGQLQKEITELRNKIRSKAQAYNMGPQNGRHNQGPHHRGNWNGNGGWCW